VVSPRRTPSGHGRKFRWITHRSAPRRRSVPTAGALLLASLLALVLGAAPASAQPPPPPPPPPTNAADAAAQLDKVQREAEALTEEWHAAQDTVDARQAELKTLRDAVGPAQSAVDAAKANEEQYRQQLDAVAMGTFESGNLDQFNALLASGSPQDFLDQMSALETLSADYKSALEQLSSVVDDTAKAQADANAAVERAQTAADEAKRAEEDVANRKRDAEIRIDQAEKLLERLSPQQRRARNGPEENAPSGPITGTGAGVEALRAAATQLG
jgi:peptidoglycan DL-endopeptidase CwlO